jgi:Protein of unknown function (DUF2878).
MFNVLNGLAYTLGWIGAVTLASSGKPCWGAIVALIFTALQLLWIKFREPAYFKIDFWLVLSAPALGFIAETIFLQLGILRYTPFGLHPFFPPLWLLSLYPLFALMINHSLLPFLKGYELVFLAPFVPLSYLAGSKLDACSFPRGFFLAAIILVVVWTLILTMLVWINQTLLNGKSNGAF